MACLFCKIINGEIDADVVYQDDQLLAFRDISPQAPTHILVIPRRHIPAVNDLSADDSTLIGELVLRAKQLAADEGIDDSGYRLVLNCNRDAGQSVDHIHLHLLGGRSMGWPPG